MRYSSFRRLASLLALLLALGIGAVSVLRAQDRGAWWNNSKPAPPVNGMRPSSTPSPTPAAANAKGVRLTRNQPGESKPLIIDADEITTWTEKLHSIEHCVLSFRGLVNVQLGNTRARFEQGVAWVDLGNSRITGKLRTEIYAEGKVRIDDGSEIHDYPRAVLDLTTRGELKVNAHRVPLRRQSRADDPLVHRGRDEGLGPRFLQPKHIAANQAAIQQTSYQRERQLILPPTVFPASPPSAPQRSPNLQPLPPLPRPPIQKSPPTSAAPTPTTQEGKRCQEPILQLF